jgi:hypothetical protein
VAGVTGAGRGIRGAVLGLLVPVGGGESVSALDPPGAPLPGAFSVVRGGYVRTIVPRGSVTYIGGDFEELGAVTGGFARLDAPSGRRNGLLPEADGGEVRASVPDGSGGFYIGGTFKVMVDGVDTGVANAFADGAGCTLADRIGEAAAGSLNLRQFLRRVDRLTRTWLRDALIDPAQAEIIRTAAARSTLLPP